MSKENPPYLDTLPKEGCRSAGDRIGQVVALWGRCYTHLTEFPRALPGALRFALCILFRSNVVSAKQLRERLFACPRNVHSDISMKEYLNEY